MASKKKKAATKKATAKKATAKKTTTKKTAPVKAPAVKKATGFQVKKGMAPKAAKAVKDAADAMWGVGVPPHELLQELHAVMLLRCLDEADGNYAGAASLFGPSRQSVQQYANSPLRDARWKQYQQNRRKKRA
ncbi:MAG: hypothetical protein KC933_18730 [Myxococcales bacterium]|nr:hypothetical protein [Myxococcales bacterium]MCB9651892.1 hypothetical protein [Deltaproteobacteria bacterium]